MSAVSEAEARDTLDALQKMFDIKSRRTTV